MSLPPESRTPLFSLVGRSWWVLVLYGLAAVAFGVIAVLRPIAAATGLAWAIGIMAIAEGGISLAGVFTGASGVSRAWAGFYALVSIGFGVLAVVNPLVTAKVLVLFLAVWLILGGIYRIAYAIRVRREIQGEWLLILSGLLAIVLGAMLVANPLAGLVVTTLWVGVGSLVYGVVQVAAGFRLRRLR